MLLISWVKAFHIIFVICWFASLFYLPRLFVYHAMAKDEISLSRFQVMESKLYFIIGTPSMIGTWIFGLWLVHLNWSYLASSPWFHIKATLVVLLSGYHGMCGSIRRKLVSNPEYKSHKFFRVFNEIPVVFLIAIVILVVVKQPA
jgi:putative membrane protein